MSTLTETNSSQSSAKTAERQTNTSFIVHMGDFQIIPKEIINTQALDEHNNPRYVANAWVLPGGKEVDLSGLAELAAKHQLPVIFERV